MYLRTYGSRSISQYHSQLKILCWNKKIEEVESRQVTDTKQTCRNKDGVNVRTEKVERGPMKKTEKEKNRTTRCQILIFFCLFYVLKVWGFFFCFPTSLLRTRGDLFSICPGSRLLDSSVVDATEATALTFNVHLIDIYVCSRDPRDDEGGGG